MKGERRSREYKSIVCEKKVKLGNNNKIKHRRVFQVNLNRYKKREIRGQGVRNEIKVEMGYVT